MQFSDIKFDCRHFRGDIPCQPNKQHGALCPTCEQYDPIRTRILLIKLGAIGDVIRTTPLLQRFHEEYPGAHISWLTHTPEILPAAAIDKIYRFDFKSLHTLAHLPFDIAVNLDKDLEACALLTAVPAGRKFGFALADGRITGLNQAAQAKLLTGAFDSVSRQNRKSYLQEIFEICGFDFRGEPYVLEVDRRYDGQWQSLHEQAQGRKIIGLNTGCGKRWLTRLWPEDHWVALVAELKTAGYFPVLLGGPEEEEQNRRLQTRSGAPYPGTFPLPQFISLAAQCHVIVTAVTMMMHIALGLRKPLVLFNNIFNPHEFELYGLGVLLQPESGCDCYFGNTCRRARPCMQDLPVATVFQAIVERSRHTP
ncbi:MAG: glycosyltransferase family 9 protein [candidate division KSB1 bacterium]|nr:glycosyltransferase family 9 protein [candidate division KSB1 bacterium]MDZ7275058.1 glycosyltransferase family 9 protein [candidate division KSB1 bacterium]MDZ7286494.1 glycosyltransferase family 9 protein [candidate division KSB1 bacterium]MDZ7299342.1 glycosyltransferase family 9 protein [candidate division KSB1 bacterium]MDZ7306330.1 glycosyltransferase family 9 protein [candidate division KSB1 bacterium]